MQVGTLEFVFHLVARRNAEEVCLLDVRQVGDAQRKGAALFDVLARFMVFVEVEGDHIFGADAAPCHVHDIHFAVFAVGRDHEHRHREYVRLYAEIF